MAFVAELKLDESLVALTVDAMLALEATKWHTRAAFCAASNSSGVVSSAHRTARRVPAGTRPRPCSSAAPSAETQTRSNRPPTYMHPATAKSE